ncbi:MAG: translesion error-prone DNA polymerase V autoproteolytic subunit [Bacteroidales bacterium]|nr:translesion error-prone DNA polymerase V autoproteolytic subunit [Bacteroidales bacterium]
MPQKGENDAIKLSFYYVQNSKQVAVPYVETIKAGFPSPADDFVATPLDLNELLIKNKSSTFFARVTGNSMEDAGISDGDILVIDRSIEPSDNRIAVCFIDGEFTVKRLSVKNNECYLLPANPKYKPIKITADNEFIIWGIVTYVIKKV